MMAKEKTKPRRRIIMFFLSFDPYMVKDMQLLLENACPTV
jgi:hypothetical protein